MAEPVWYYARGETERGPFTLPQIKALVHASKVRPDDLVWKEGMDNWTAAREVAELFPPARPPKETPSNGSDSSVEMKPNGGPAPAPPTVDDELRPVLQRAVRIVAAVGALVVLGTSGCQTLSARRVERLVALAEIRVSEDAANAATDQAGAQRAVLEHQAAGFLREVSRQLGLLLLLAGGVGLFLLAARSSERWLGLGLVLVVLLGATRY